MDSLKSNNLRKDRSFDDFEFVDAEGDLNVDLSKSPIYEAAEKVGSGLSLIISALSTIVEEQGMIVTLPVKAMATTAVGALTGSLIGGPSGLAVGLITGAVIAYRTSPTRSKTTQEPTKTTIRQVFEQMTFKQKKELLKELLGCLKQSNVRILIVEILKNEKLRRMALGVLSDFLKKKMGVCLTREK